MTADIRTADLSYVAREAADTVALTIGEDSAMAQGFTFSCTNGCTEMHAHSQGVVLGFTEGAVWAAARLTPTREQIEDVLRKSGAWCGDCNFEMDHCSGCKHVREVYAESVLRLIQELAEGESDGSDI